MELFDPGTLLYLGFAIVLACWGVSLVIKAWRGKRDDCQCKGYDLDEMESELDRLSSAIAEIRLQMQPETARRIDQFLDDPSTGVRAERPTPDRCDPMAHPAPGA